jgi:dTDP-4-amino-4,6-dideoxygalactose transaminase
MASESDRAPIPMLDLEEQTAALWPQLSAAFEQVMRSGRYILGPQLEAFEREAAQFLGAAHAVGVASGTDALLLALRALQIGPGDEVITPAFTFVATAEAIRLAGATPIFADIEPDSFCMSPGSAAARVGPRTRALLPVHLYGHPADMDALGHLAKEHGLALIEDVAQAFGARHGAHRLGSLGELGAFSFFPSKNLGAFGDGGLATTNSAQLADRLRLLRNHGQRDRYTHVELGYTSRLDELQAALLRVKLPHLERWNRERQAVADAYREALADVEELVLPSDPAAGSHSFHQFTLRVRGGRRDALQAALRERGVTSVIYYPEPLHRIALYLEPGREKPLELPEAERASREVLSLPIWPELGPARARGVASRLRDALASVA